MYIVLKRGVDDIYVEPKNPRSGYSSNQKKLRRLMKVLRKHSQKDLGSDEGRVVDLREESTSY